MRPRVLAGRVRLNSLAWRLIAASALWAVVALVAAGLILVSLYRSTVENAFDQRLSVYLRTLVGGLSAEDPTQPFSDPGNLGEQRFELLYSGWYWQVRDAATRKVVLASGSLFSDTIDVSKATGDHAAPTASPPARSSAPTSSRCASSPAPSPSNSARPSSWWWPATPANSTTRSPASAPASPSRWPSSASA